jgi:hypothetical protein
MSDNFALGHDIKVTLFSGEMETPVPGFDDCVSFEWDPQIVIVEQKSLGQSTNHFNSDPQGFKGSATFNVTNVNAINFVNEIYQRAQRKIAFVKYGFKYQIFGAGIETGYVTPADGQGTTTFNFTDVVFESPKVSAASKDGLVEVSFNWACSNANKQ